MMIPSLVLGLVVPCAYAGILPRHIDLTELVRGTPEAARSIKFLSRGTFGDDLPYSESAMTSASEVNMNAVPSEKRKCFSIRRLMLGEGVLSSVDVASPHIDHQVASPGHITVTSSKSLIDSSRLGWVREDSAESGGSLGVSGSVEAGLAGLGSVSASTTLNVKTITYQGSCPSEAICTVLTWTYTRAMSGHCHTVPLVDAGCYGGLEYPIWHEGKLESRMPLSDNVSVLAFVANKNGPLRASPQHALQPWAKAISDTFWELSPSISGELPASLVGNDFRPTLERGIRMHSQKYHSRNIFYAQCKFKHALLLGDGTPVSTQAMLVERDGLDQSPPPVLFTAVRWNSEGEFCELNDGWQYSITSLGHFYAAPVVPGQKRDWLNQDVRPKWPKMPLRVFDRCPQLRVASESLHKRSDDQVATLVDRISIIEDGLEDFIGEADREDGRGSA